MTDERTEAPLKPDNPLIGHIYKNLMDILEFSKKQQWTITNYSVLVYAAIFAITHAHYKTDINAVEKAVACFVVLITWACAFALLINIQFDMGRHRERLQKMAVEYIDKKDREAAGVRDYGPCPAMRGWQFLLALLGVVTIGAAIVIYSVARP